MNKILTDLKGVNVITDDILVYGKDVKEHNERLLAVLQRAREANLKLNPQKSKICQQQVNYVGHALTPEGITPNYERVQAIIDLPTPSDKAGVQRFLGMVGYVSKFIPQMAEITKPLRVVLQKNTAWHWDEPQDKAFMKLKNLLITAPVVAYYNVNKNITLQVDASKSGLGAVLMQEGHPIAMASKALDETQSNYAVIEKELLAICFGCHKFHEYIYGKHVTIETDHKPLVSIMQKPLFQLSSRMQRMRMRLQNYDLNVTYLKGEHMYFADTISRAHTNRTTPNNLFDNQLTVAPLSFGDINLGRIANETINDPILSEVIKITQNGWPEHIKDISNKIRPYFT